MATMFCKHCRATAKYLQLSFRRPRWIAAQNFSLRFSLSEATDCDTFGELAKEFREKTRDSENKQSFARDFRKPPSHQPWTEKFGTLSSPSKSVVMDPAEEVHFESWNNISKCCKEMQRLVKDGKLSSAFELLDATCHSEQIRPNAFLYNVLIGACGRIGDTKRAFKLYRQMKERQLVPDESTYTSLFNACSNSPSKQEGHRQAMNLYKKIQSDGRVPNTTNYLAMLKAFGWCGDIQTSFHIADEMSGSGHMLDSRVLECLLSACVTDKHNGFHWALQVWRRFRQKKVRPSLHSYHLFLRVIKECGTGSRPIKAEQTYIGAYSTLIPTDVQTTAVATTSEVQSPETRLSAVGGVDSILVNLANDHLHPDVLTFTNLLFVVPDSTAAETTLLSTMKQYGVKPDTAFFNGIIKRRNFRNDYAAALDVLSLMQECAVVPDLLTFGVLALGCKTKRDAQHLLRDMQVAGFRPNIEIFGAMLKHACWRNNWPYACEMLAKMREHEVLPNDRLLRLLEKSIARTKENILLLEKGHDVPTIFTKFAKREYLEQFQLFLTVYKGWLQVMPVSPECYEQKQVHALRRKQMTEAKR